MRLIDADALILSFCDNPSYSATMFSKIRGRINAAPTIEAEPVKHGRWVKDGDFLICLECESEINIKNSLGVENHKNYCPNCGAKMDGGAENAD